MSYQYRHVRQDLTPLWVIMGINIIIFLVAQFNSHIIDIFALSSVPAVVLSQPWTVITSIFTHYEFFHILANMFTLYFFGTFLCQLVGNKYMLMIYFGGGIVGSIFFILLSFGAGYAIGASGAIFALGGALVALRPQTRVVIIPIPVPMPLWVAVIGGFILLTVITLVFGLGIAWQAHLGGLISGLIAGFFLRKRTRMVLL